MSDNFPPFKFLTVQNNLRYISLSKTDSKTFFSAFQKKESEVEHDEGESSAPYVKKTTKPTKAKAIKVQLE